MASSRLAPVKEETKEQETNSELAAQDSNETELVIVPAREMDYLTNQISELVEHVEA